MPRDYRVKTMGEGIAKLCAADVSRLLQNDGNLGCGNGRASVYCRTVEDGW